jgi:hypothetical protein
MLLSSVTQRMEAECQLGLEQQAGVQGRQLLLNYLPGQEFLFLHLNMLLLAPPTIYPAGNLKMRGC